MRKPQNERRRPQLRKETVRKLDRLMLGPEELGQVVGGARKVTCPCPTEPTGCG